MDRLRSATADWRPESYAGIYLGQVHLDQAFAQSPNAGTVRLVQDVGIGAKLERNISLTGDAARICADILGRSGNTISPRPGKAFGGVHEGCDSGGVRPPRHGDQGDVAFNDRVDQRALQQTRQRH